MPVAENWGAIRDAITFQPDQAIRHAPVPPYVLSCDLPEAPPKLGLVNVDNLGGVSLSAVVLAYHPAGEPFRAQKFPSARGFLRRVFSFSS